MHCAVAGIFSGRESTRGADPLREIVTAGRLVDLRWPDFADYRGDVQAFYDASGFAPAWSRNGQPTAQARAIIELLQQADGKGLGPDDYDAPRWAERANQLSQPDGIARFDVALTVCLMRYASDDLELGKVNPKQVKFSIAKKNSRYDLAQFLRQDLVNSSDVKAALAQVEPPFPYYQRTLVALQHYQELARQDNGGQLPVPPKTLEAGSPYSGAARLAVLLRLFGDLPADAVVPAGDLYQPPLVDAVKHFQERHGLTADGHLGAQTVKQLNTPLNACASSSYASPWNAGVGLPHAKSFRCPPVVVNVPEVSAARV